MCSGWIFWAMLEWRTAELGCPRHKQLQHHSHPLGGQLHQRFSGLLVEDLESLLEASNLGFTAGLSLFVGLWLGNALLLNLLEVLQDCRELGLNTLLVGAELGDGLVEAGGLLGLVLDICLLGGLLNLVLLGLLIVSLLGALLSCVHLCQVLGEVRFADLQEADDARASTIRRAVGLVRLGIVLVEHFQGKLHAVEALLHLSAVLLPSSLLLRTELVHLGLRLDQGRKLSLQCCDFLAQLGCLGSGGLNVGSELLNLGLLVALLGVGLSQLLIAVSLLGGISLGLGLELLDHIGDQSLHFRKNICLVAATKAHSGGHARGKLGQHRRVLFLGELTDETHDMVGVTSLNERCGLLNVRLISSATSGLHNDLLCGGKCLQFLTTALCFLLVLLGLGHAVVMELRKCLDVFVQVLGGDLEIALGGGLLLLGGRLALRSLGLLLVCELHLVLETLLEHLV